MSKVQYKKFKATIEYKVEVTEDWKPNVKDETTALKQLLKGDPEMMKPKVELEEVE